MREPIETTTKSKGEMQMNSTMMRESDRFLSKVKVLWAIVAVMAAWPVTSQATLNQLINFTNTSTDWPTGFGYTGTTDGPGSVAPTQSGSIMTIAEPSGYANFYWDGSAMAPSIAGPVYYGEAKIQLTTASSNFNDVNVLQLARPISGGPAADLFALGVAAGKMTFQRFATVVNLTVGNSSGYHYYGWEADSTADKVKFFFDGMQVGALAGYGPIIDPTWGSSGRLWWGDNSGTAGDTHSDNWDFWTIGEGSFVTQAVPEPATMGLLALGATMAWLRRRHAS